MKIIHRNKKKKDSEKMWIEFLNKNYYPESQVERVAVKLNQMPEDLQNALLEWDSFGKLPDISSEGFSATELVDGFGLTPIAAILMLNWLRNDPEEAKTALAQPVSRIVVGDNSYEEIIKAEDNDQDVQDDSSDSYEPSDQ